MSQENDIVLIYCEDKPLTFARIEEILPDHKKDWYHVKMLILQIPVQTVTWILRSAYIDGAEFTMNGKSMRLKPVISPEEDQKKEDKKTKTQVKMKKNATKAGSSRVISLPNRRKPNRKKH
ncbi:hypothetical protein BuS5_03368 [Desulfosarcina sp. BuS5]|uniref:hypothetical protein n=1 Tax=Desulfosarcina sp. BuS5 TaxID=933262 RepID=UPI0004812687|nr:hypothetical protein [Desulfosarcina sp. BuS5]WDN90397.1 hypothetical protein BuS5_03368 [Desulfosarcina sp. BuS5]